ncbi:pimeloyl-ACP methyl ester carboxylesterase [Pseudomonas frederiksbergensis]
MPTQQEFSRVLVPLSVDGVDLTVAALHRGGDKAPIVFLHGFGSTKEDYADIVRYAAYNGHPFLAYDAPAVVKPAAQTSRASAFHCW